MPSDPLEIIRSVKCEGKTSLENSYFKQSLFWGELTEFQDDREKFSAL